MSSETWFRDGENIALAFARSVVHVWKFHGSLPKVDGKIFSRYRLIKLILIKKIVIGSDTFEHMLNDNVDIVLWK